MKSLQRWSRIVIVLLVSCLLPSWSEIAWAETATVAWDANPAGTTTGYKLYRLIGACATQGAPAFLTDVGNVTTYTDNSIPVGSVGVRYQVTAYNTTPGDAYDGESAKSVTVCKTFVIPPPPVPGGLKVTQADENHVTVAWTQGPGGCKWVDQDMSGKYPKLKLSLTCKP